MAEIDWESLASCLLNLLDKCELAFDETTYPIAANAFNGVELALSVIRHIADSADEQQSLFVELCECFGEIHQLLWQQVVDIGRRTTSAVDLGIPSTSSNGPFFNIPPIVLEELRGIGFTWSDIAKMLNVSRWTINRRVKELVYKNNRRSLLWEPNSIFMHIPCIHFVLFCTPIWLPSHVSENHLFQRPLKESKEWRIHVFT